MSTTTVTATTAASYHDFPAEILETIFQYAHSLKIKFYERPEIDIQLKDVFGKSQNGFFVRMYPCVDLVFKEAGVEVKSIIDADALDFLWKYAIDLRVICAYKSVDCLRQILSEQPFDSLNSLSVNIIGYDAITHCTNLDSLFTETLQKETLKRSVKSISYQNVVSEEMIDTLFSFPNLKSILLGLRIPDNSLSKTVTLDKFDSFVKHKSLESVTISGARRIVTINSILRNQNLKYIEYGISGLGADEETLLLLESHSNLVQLAFAADDVPKEALRRIVQIPTIKRLTLYTNAFYRRFSLSDLLPPVAKGNLVSFHTNAKLIEWEALIENKHLKELTVPFFKYREETMESLTKYGVNLTTLHLIGNALHDIPLVNLLDMVSLKVLDLVRVSVIDSNTIVALLASNKLEKLYVSIKAFSTANIEAFKETYGERIHFIAKTETSSATLLF